MFVTKQRRISLAGELFTLKQLFRVAKKAQTTPIKLLNVHFEPN